ncbi:MAG TPA: 4Fe-4S binding protein [Candidatus Gracilibacteria bacterium]|nr:4Fe-4S binding protein [Candidatus Gracilibacteria bacterium]
MIRFVFIILGLLISPLQSFAAGAGHAHGIVPSHETDYWIQHVQWGVVAGFAALILSVYFVVRYGVRKLQFVDVLDYGGLRKFVKSRWYPAIFQIPALFVFLGIFAYLFFGSYYYAENPGSILVWTFWWAVLPFSFILVGRLWCAVCPFAWVSDFVQKHFGRKRRIPVWMAKYSFWIVDLIFIFITWFDRVFGMTEHPFLTGLIFISILAGVIVCGFLYEKRAFCRYICFLGNVAGNYSMVAPLELKPKDPKVCASCVQKSCYFGKVENGKVEKPGCPFNQVIPTKDGNRFCVLCGNCVKVCPHDNIALTLRPFGSDFWKRAYVRFEESFFAKMLVGIVIIQNIGMLALWGNISDVIRNVTGIADEKILFTLIYFFAMSIPLVLMFISSFISAKFAKEKTVQNFARFGYAFIAVDLAGHLAHNLNHLLGEGKTILAAFAGFFSGQVQQFIDLSLFSQGTIKILQYLILSLGVIGTLYITYRIAQKKAPDRSALIKTMIPHLVLLGVLMAVNFFIFSLPMIHRS